MTELPRKYIESLKKAIYNIKIADHMLYVTYPVIKDKRLLLKSLEQVYESVIEVINAILQYDFYWKKIQLTNLPRVNFETFVDKCSPRYGITQEELTDIIELLSIAENHKKSGVEFLRKDKIVIMNDSLRTSTIDSDKLKKYLNLAKKLIEKAKFSMSIE